MTRDEMGLAIANVVAEWAALLRYFPQDEISKAAIMRFVDSLVNNAKELAWLRDSMINRVGEWSGSKELRGIFCSKFRPKDGIEIDSTHADFSPVSGEARSAQLEPPKEQRLIAGAQLKELFAEAPELSVRFKQAAATKKIGKVRKSDVREAQEFAERAGL